MNTKLLFVLTLLCISITLSAQEANPAVAYTSIEKSNTQATISYQEKDVLIHRYVLDGKVDIELNSGGKAIFTLFNADRVEIKEYEMSFPKKSTHSINTSDLKEGTYYIRVKKDNQSYVRKILVE